MMDALDLPDRFGVLWLLRRVSQSGIYVVNDLSMSLPFLTCP